jgi:plasmid stabilization system protein ParE
MFTDAANHDIQHQALLLCLSTGSRPRHRITRIRREARLIAENPKLYPVEWVHPISGIEFRCKNVDQFVIIYAYFEPTSSMPNGLVSVRAIRHGRQRNIFWCVEESGAVGRHRTSPLVMRADSEKHCTDVANGILSSRCHAA